MAFFLRSGHICYLSAVQWLVNCLLVCGLNFEQISDMYNYCDLLEPFHLDYCWEWSRTKDM